MEVAILSILTESYEEPAAEREETKTMRPLLCHGSCRLYLSIAAGSSLDSSQNTQNGDFHARRRKTAGYLLYPSVLLKLILFHACFAKRGKKRE